MCSDMVLKPMDTSERDIVVATAASVHSDSGLALREIARSLGMDRAGKPDFVTLHHGSARSVAALFPEAMKTFGTAALHGASSCLGVMTQHGVAFGKGDAMGAFAVWDPEGAYGTAMSTIGADPVADAAATIRKALARAGRPGEAPDLVWLTATPGEEEAILRGIKSVIGASALILGASAADNTVAGRWSVFSSDGVAEAGMVISVLFPSVPFGSCFESGYVSTELHGTVTAAEGRRLLRIDDRPAAEVFSEWTSGTILPPGAGSRSILSEATLSPLGRKQMEIGGIPVHCLLHPAIAHSDGSLDLFAEPEVGEKLWLMQGSYENLVQRAGRIAASSRAQIDTAPVAGALVVYCGGCMLAVRERMDEVAESIAQSLGGAPFLGVFSFGEQGEMPAGEAVHGNLMISCAAFGSRPSSRSRRQ